MQSAEDFPGGSVVEKSACNAGDMDSIPGVGKIPWRRKWQPTPVFLPGKSHGQRSLVAYSRWDHKRAGHDRTRSHIDNVLIVEEMLICGWDGWQSRHLGKNKI